MSSVPADQKLRGGTLAKQRAEAALGNVSDQLYELFINQLNTNCRSHQAKRLWRRRKVASLDSKSMHCRPTFGLL